MNVYSSVGDLELKFDGVDDFIDGVNLDSADVIKKTLNDRAYSCYFIENTEALRTTSVKNHDETLSYKPVVVIPGKKWRLTCWLRV